MEAQTIMDNSDSIIMNMMINNTPSRPTDDESDHTDNSLGFASDYILIAMIVAMMLCMAICCLCLFCRSSAHFTICGYSCDVNDRNNSVANEDISELHEVVPLTPAVVDTYNLPDIESKLKSDPPPPQYSEVAGSSVLDRFKWRSKKKGNVSENANDDDTSTKGDEIVRSKSKRSEKRSRLSKTFYRSTNNQISRAASNPKSSSSLKAKQCKGSSKKSSLQHSVSDCTLAKTVHEELHYPTSEKNMKKDANLTLTRVSETSQDCKEHGADVYDDEVFM